MTARVNNKASSEMCPGCRGGPVEVVQRTAEHLDGTLRVSFPDEVSRCTDCGEVFYTYEQSLAHSQAVTAALRDDRSLMSRERIRAARVNLRMTIPQFEQAMGVGMKTVGRWERGTVPPSRAANGMLWLAERYPEIFLEYAGERAGVRPAPADSAVVATIHTAPSATSRPIVFRATPARSGQVTTRVGNTDNRAMVLPDKELVIG